MARCKEAAAEKRRAEEQVQEERTEKEFRKAMQALAKNAVEEAKKHKEDVKKSETAAKQALTAARAAAKASIGEMEEQVAAASKAAADANISALKAAEAVIGFDSKSGNTVATQAKAAASRAAKWAEDARLALERRSKIKKQKAKSNKKSRTAATQGPEACCGEGHDTCHCGICSDDYFHPAVPTLWHACDFCDTWWCGECVGCYCDGPACECGGGSNPHQDGCE